MYRILGFLLFSLLFITNQRCKSKNTRKDVKDEWVTLKNGLARIHLKVDDIPFYEENSTFKGVTLINEDQITINLKDELNGNLILNIEQTSWYKKKPYAVTYNKNYSTSDKKGSLIFGKMKTNNLGEGFVFIDGVFKITAIDKEICYIEINGLVKRPFGDNKSYPISGWIVWKFPPLDSANINIKEYQIHLE